MVDVILKGSKREGWGIRSFEIIRFKAQVTHREKGGVFVTISNQSLSKKIKELLTKG